MMQGNSQYSFLVSLPPAGRGAKESAHLLFLLALALVLLFITAAPALADVLALKPTALECIAVVDPVTQQKTLKPNVLSIFATQQGVAQTTTDQLGACSGGAFSRFICLFETTLGMVIATFFCSIQHEWIAPFAALVMMFMAGMGIMFITGMVEFTVKEITVMMLKLAVITTFAFNTDIALGVAFKFFMGMTQNSVEMLSGVFTNPNTGAPITPGFDMADAHITGKGTPPATANCTFSGLAGVAGIFFFLVAMLLFLPFVFGVFVLASIAASGFFSRAAFGYLYSLVIITFLIAAMPIFVGLALFATTRDIFDGWLKYLLSNSIQIILVFAFLAYAGNVNVGDFLTDIGRLLTNYEYSFSTPPLSWVSLGSVCTICTPNIIPHPNPLFAGMTIIAPSPNQCKDPAGISWLNILDQHEFITYLITHGVTVYVITAALSDFMKDVPEMSHSLGGSSGSMIIGGISRQYTPGRPGNSLVAPGFTNATLNFEKSFANAWKSGKSFDKEGQSGWMWLANRTFPLRFAAAIAGTYNDMKYGTSELSKAEAQELAKQKRMGKARGKQKILQNKSDVKRHELSIENLEKAKEELKAKNAASQKIIETLREEAEKAKLGDSLKSPELKEMEGKLIALEQTIQKNEQALVSNLEAIVALQSKIEKKEAEFSDGKVKTKEKAEALVAMQQALDKLKAERAGIEQELDNNIKKSDTDHKAYQEAAKKEIAAQIKQKEIDLEEWEKRIEEWKKKAQKDQDDEELKFMLKKKQELEDELIALQSSLNAPLASLDYQIAELKARESQLALDEVTAKLSRHTGALKTAEAAVKEAESSAAYWDKLTSDPRFARGQMDLNYEDPEKNKIGHSGGLIEDFWNSGADANLFYNENVTKAHGSKRDTEFAWSSLMHMGDR